MRLSIQYITAVMLLISVTVVLQHTSRAEEIPDRTPFVAFPLELQAEDFKNSKWLGREVGLDPEILSVLKVEDHMMRVYVPAGNEGHSENIKGERDKGAPQSSPLTRDASRLTPRAPVWLYTGYYQTQRTGVTYHSPLNCLPGSGWTILRREVVPLALDQGPGHDAAFHVNKVVIRKGFETQLILYWYQDRGRTITSEYWAKAYLLLDAMTRNRTDGALVRISVPVVSSSEDRRALEEAFGTASQFLQDVFPRLSEHLPA